MDWCQIDGCDRTVNRDGLCLSHKLKHVRVNTARLKAHRESHTSSWEIQNEIFTEAKRQGREIERAR